MTTEAKTTPTLSDTLRASLTGDTAGPAGPQRVPRQGTLPTSQAQRYLWFINEMAPDSPAYNVPLALRLKGDLDRDAMTTAMDKLIQRHESLRTRFGSESGVPFQVIDPTSPMTMGTADFSDRPDAESAALAAARDELRRPFDLREGPIIRGWLGRIGPEDHVLLLTVHHIVMDGSSVGVIAGDLAELYSAAVAGRPPALEQLSLQPADLAVWQQQSEARHNIERQVAHWCERLADLQHLDFPADGTEPTGAGATINRELDREIGHRLLSLSRESRTPLLAVLSAAFFVVLEGYTGQQDLAFGSILSGRTLAESEQMVGLFANSVVLRASLDGDPTFRELLDQSRDRVIEAIENQEAPFGRVVEAVDPVRLPGRNPLFQISFTLLTEGIVGTFTFGDLDVTPLDTPTGTSRFDLAVQLTHRADDTFAIWAEHSTELFESQRIEQLLEDLCGVLAQVGDDPEARLSDIVVASPESRRAMLEEWNRPEREQQLECGPEQRLLHELVPFAEHADRAAVRTATGGTTYAEVERRSRQLAHLLQRRFGSGPDALVGVLLGRGDDIPVGQLGALRSGAAWLPLDPGNPAARLALQVRDSGAIGVVTTTALAGLVPDGTPFLCLDDPATQAELASMPEDGPECAAGPDNLAYVIYTSGSSGNPKGVMISHHAAANFVRTITELFDVTADDRILQFANPAFDVSLFDIYAALSRGASLVVAETDELHDPERLAALLRRERITLCDLPPAVLKLMDGDELTDLRLLWVGLEAFTAELVNAWRRPWREFHNGYGPTEATVACVDYTCPTEALTQAPPIGRPMALHRVWTLDRRGRPTPVGVPGELHVAGSGLARGYLGSAGLTASSFVPCPYPERPGERMYRTGDLATWGHDGQLRFAGRTDDQVKIRGLRIELGEIDSALQALPGVTGGRCVLRRDTGDPTLAAYVVMPSGDPDVSELRTALAERLPSHMVPATYTVVPELPLTPNGKLDVRRLPEPEEGSGAASKPISTGTEREIAEIWAGLLGVEHDSIYADSNFFSLGGTSLQVTQFLSRVRNSLLVALDPRVLFRAPELERIAGAIDAQLEGMSAQDPELAALEQEIAGMSEEEIERLLQGQA